MLSALDVSLGIHETQKEPSCLSLTAQLPALKLQCNVPAQQLHENKATNNGCVKAGAIRSPAKGDRRHKTRSRRAIRTMPPPHPNLLPFPPFLAIGQELNIEANLNEISNKNNNNNDLQ